MSFARIRDLLRSLSFRLTLWYAGLLLLALGMSYLVSYLLVFSLAVRRMDTYLLGEAEECKHLYQLKGASTVVGEAQIEVRAHGSSDVYFRLLDRNGELEFQTEPTLWKDAVVGIKPLDSRPGAPLYATRRQQGSTPEVRVIAYRLSPSDVLVIAASMDSDLRLIHDSMRLVLFVMFTAWLLAVILGFTLARRALRGIRAIHLAAANLTRGKTDSRVSYPVRGDEIGALAAAFNLMADRIENLLRNLRETNDNLAHELRSTITRIRGRCELALTYGAQASDFHTLTAETIEQCDLMLTTINSLLEISETEAGVIRVASKELDLHELLAGACEIFAPIAEEKRVKLTLAADRPVLMLGDRGKLQRLFSNLLDNALKFTPPGGSVSIHLRSKEEGVSVTIADTGPGIPLHEQAIIFERFARGSAANGHPGNGLGLSLARTLARAHGGDIHVRSDPGQGAQFIVTLPRRSGGSLDAGPEARRLIEQK